MKNNTLNYYFYTLNGGFVISLKAHSQESLVALYELHSIFFEMKGDRYFYDKNNVYYVTMKMKEEIRLYTNKYRDFMPQINQLQAKIYRMECGEAFVILGIEPDSTANKLIVENIVFSANVRNGKSAVDRINSSQLEIFQLQIQGYKFFSPRVDIRTAIGPSRKRDRRCRFCGRTSVTGAKFKKVAHAIPESIGNKSIICNEECDSCNDFFGATYEKSLVEYFNFYRVISGVKSKEGYPKIYYKNGFAFHKNGVAQVYAENFIEDEQGNLKIELQSNEYYSDNHFYKSLCKMALSIVDVSELCSLQRTLRWLMDKDDARHDLPLVGTLVNRMAYAAEPKIVVITRVDDSLMSPHVLCELTVGYYQFVFILPYSEKDELKYSSEYEISQIFKVFPQFSTDLGWVYKPFSTSEMVKPIILVDINNYQAEQ